MGHRSSAATKLTTSTSSNNTASAATGSPSANARTPCIHLSASLYALASVLVLRFASGQPPQCRGLAATTHTRCC
jgi:hypothetical protein